MPDLVLLVHGLGCTGESFGCAFGHPALAGAALLAPDLPGHGGRQAGHPCTLQACADDLASTLAAHPAPRVHLVGHSLGGAVALLLAPRLGARLASFACAEGNLLPEDCTLSRAVAATREADFLGGGFERLRCAVAEDPAARTWAARVDPRALYALACDLVRWSDSGLLLGRFLGLGVRRCYVCGDRSRLPAVTARLGDTPVVTLPGAGHGLMLDNPDAFCRWLAAWTAGGPG